MPTGQWAVVLRHVRRLFEGDSVSGLTEGQLLERFVATREGAAFEALLTRHGPMVLGVCRGLLNDPNDVEDAFQATFLVLVRKAGSLRDGDRLAQWLYGVARKVSLRARSDATRRKAREHIEREEVVDAHATLDTDLRELQTVIREEVDRLSGNDRMAVVLCYLEGLTHEEAADRLGWPVGTVKGRLSRAREKLKLRLTRRGVALPAAAVGSTLTARASAAVPIALIRSTTQAAIQLASGKPLVAGIISAQALTLMKGTLNTMFATKLKIAASALVTTCVLGVPGVLAYQQPLQKVGGTAPAIQPPEEPSPPTPSGVVKTTLQKTTSKSGEPPTRTGLVEMARLSEQAVKIVEPMVQNARVEASELVTWSRRLALAKAGSNAPEGERRAVLEAHRDRMKHLIEITRARKDAARGTDLPVLEAEFSLAEAEQWLRDGMAGSLAEARSPIQGVRDPGTMRPVGIDPKSAAMGLMPGGPGGKRGGSEGGAAMVRGGLTLNQTPADEKRNDAIRAKLEEPLSMNFSSPTPLSDVLKYLKDATQDEAGGFATGLPIYLDPEGLTNAEVTTASTVSIQLEGIPLRTTLHLFLRQVGLDYRVDGGVVLISDRDQIAVQEIKANRAGVLKP